MNIQQLEYLIAVDDLKHFARAAEHCNVTQPTLSTMIQKMEEELNVKIFNRSKHPIESTEIGKQIIAQARVSLQQLSKIKKIVNAEQTTISGTFRLSIIPTIAPYLVPQLLSKQYTQFPDLELIIKEQTTKKIIEQLQLEYIDGAILAGPILNEDFISFPIYYEKFYAYVSPLDELYKEKEIDIESVDISKVWLLENVHCLRGQIERLCKARNSYQQGNIKFESGSIDTLLHVVDMNPGITIIPEMHAMGLAEEKQDSLRPFKNMNAVREVCLIVSKHNAKTAIQNCIIDSIKESVPKSMQNPELKQYVVAL